MKEKKEVKEKKVLNYCEYENCELDLDLQKCPVCGKTFCKAHIDPMIHICKGMHNKPKKDPYIFKYLIISGIVILILGGMLFLIDSFDWSEIFVVQDPDIDNALEPFNDDSVIGPPTDVPVFEYEMIDDLKLKVLTKSCLDIEAEFSNLILRDREFFDVCRDHCGAAKMGFGGQKYCNAQQELICICD